MTFHRVRQPMPWTKSGSQVIDRERLEFFRKQPRKWKIGCILSHCHDLEMTCTFSEIKVFVCTVYFVLADQTTARRIEQRWFTGHLANREETSAEISSGIISLALSVFYLLTSETQVREFRLEWQIYLWHNCCARARICMYVCVCVCVCINGLWQRQWPINDLPVSCQIESLARFLEPGFATLKKCENLSVLTRFRKHYIFPKQISCLVMHYSLPLKE
jgi:hypothetical protein